MNTHGKILPGEGPRGGDLLTLRIKVRPSGELYDVTFELLGYTGGGREAVILEKSPVVEPLHS